MSMIYADPSESRFFLIPTDASLPQGRFVLTTLTGKSISVEEKAASAFEIPEDLAKAKVQELIAGVGQIVEQVVGAISRMGDPSKASLPDRLQAVFTALGVSPADLPKEPSALADALGEHLMALGPDKIRQLCGG